MKSTAFRVWRWVERMNAIDQDAGEYGAVAPELTPADAVPETLVALLRFIAEDYLPEVAAFVSYANAWLAKAPFNDKDLHRPMTPRDRLDEAFTWRAERTLSQSLTLQYDNSGRALRG
jgi:hypothetical protein